MKLFHAESEKAGRVAPGRELETISQLAIDTGVQLVRMVKAAVRSSAPDTISLSGLRTLAYLADAPGGCLSDVAEHLFIGNPTASKLVDDLVARGLLVREADATDRRKLALSVTAEGKDLVRTAARPAQERIAERLAQLSATDRKRVRLGLELLHGLLEGDEREAAG